MFTHISIRLPYMDTSNKGKVCANPKANCYCSGNFSVGGGLIGHYKRSQLESEIAYAGKAISKEYIPPCSAHANVFGSQPIPHRHLPPAWMRGKIGALPETTIPPYSGFTWPYEEVIANDPEAESTWGTPEEREDNVKNFFKQLKPNGSICVFYYNFDNPIVGLSANPDEKFYVVAGFSRLSSVGSPEGEIAISRWNNMDPAVERKMGNQVWAIPYTHDFAQHGFLMPLHDVLHLEDGLTKAQEIALRVPAAMVPGFKYVCNTLTDDQLITLLQDAIFLIGIAGDKGYLTERDALERIERAEALLREAKVSRSRYPGLGSVLEFLGVAKGTVYHRVHLTRLAAKGIELKEWLLEGLKCGKFDTTGLPNLPSSQIVSRFKSLTEPTKTFLIEHAIRMNLTLDQIDEIVRSEDRWENGFSSRVEDINENPYLIVEEYVPGSTRGERFPPVDLGTIDNMMFFETKPEDEFMSPHTSRERIRAIQCEVLRSAANSGHSYLPLNDLVEKVNHSLQRHGVKFQKEFLEGEQNFFAQKLVFKDDKVYLRTIFEDERFVEHTIKTFLQRGNVNQAVKLEWLLPKRRESLSEERYNKSIRRHAEACQKLLKARISVIRGSAGTGKTEIAKTFNKSLQDFGYRENRVKDFEFVGLAFTGKAANNLKKRIGNSYTIHKKLTECGEISTCGNFLMRRKETGKLRTKNLIIDECSMLDVELFANICRVVDWDYLDRLILIGDVYQLPPIGPGRPFAEVISYLQLIEPGRDSHSLEDNKYLTSLTEIVRVNKDRSLLLEFSGLFADKSRSALHRILSSVEQEPDSDLAIVRWNTQEELMTALIRDIDSRCKSISGEEDFFRALSGVLASDISAVQVLSPYNVEFFGTEEVNEAIQKALNAQGKRRLLATSLNAFFEGDKVIQVENQYEKMRDFRDFRQGKRDVYNGYQGIIDDFKTVRDYKDELRQYKRTASVTFEGDENLKFLYRISDLKHQLRLGFCITVHKAQGSEFGVNYFILPKVARRLPRELIYTGLTRGVNKTVLLLEASPDDGLDQLLIDLSSTENSAILNRNTCLFGFEPNPENIFREQSLKHQHHSGIRFRSKSEILIFNLLEELGSSRGWRVLYEQKLILGDTLRAPDFKIITPNRTYWLEHIGMHASDAGYREEWEEKERWYRKHGVLDQLIITSEFQGLNLETVRRTILDKVVS